MWVEIEKDNWINLGRYSSIELRSVDEHSAWIAGVLDGKEVNLYPGTPRRCSVVFHNLKMLLQVASVDEYHRLPSNEARLAAQRAKPAVIRNAEETEKEELGRILRVIERLPHNLMQD